MLPYMVAHKIFYFVTFSNVKLNLTGWVESARPNLYVNVVMNANVGFMLSLTGLALTRPANCIAYKGGYDNDDV